MKQTFLIALSVFTLISCKNNSETQSPENTTKIEHTETEAQKSDQLTLNNNEKWLVNDEMKPHILKGEELVTLYIKENGTDYKQLAANLKEENSKLIKSCTMKGESHEELHKWLHPHLEIVSDLENATEIPQAQEIVQKLSASYETYHQFFN
ncbi:hypothetical protein [Flavobacterium sp.]|uniref:hypothetical protein n=1 Tax=Flavobacterium sp. TaxID=239 RepID=UPI00262A65A4|nr:hypothetical protein [Flavobacterium sp.]MDD3005023.1 hypothetical protein [Flavobacterium sp.]